MAAFNVQWFTPSKASDRDVINVVSRIINRYDVILIQEIRDDVRQTAMTSLWAAVNQTQPYMLTLSEPLGRYPDFYTEQYGFFSRLSSTHVTGAHQYNDSAQDVFEREPFSASFSMRSGAAAGISIPFIAAHLQPKNVRGEMSHMVPVVDDVMTYFSTSVAVVMGDLNAACRYLSADALAHSPMRNSTRFSWLIPDTSDTTVSTHTDCAYDRIILVNNNNSNTSKSLKSGKAGVFRFDTEYQLTEAQTKAVSDHYPVEATLYAV